jgi:hypothetical protein
MPELVVDLPLLVVRENLKGLVRFLEACLGFLVAGVAIGVVLERLALVRLSQLLRGRAL